MSLDLHLRRAVCSVARGLLRSVVDRRRIRPRVWRNRQSAGAKKILICKVKKYECD